MVDVTLILPPAQVQNVGAGGQQAQNATQGGIPTPAAVTPGTLLTGVIVGNDAHGSYFLKTDQGTVTLRSSVPLTYNSDVTVRVDTTNGNNANAKIISVNGEAYSTYSAPASEDSDTLSPSLLARTRPTVTAQVTDSPVAAAKPVAIQAVTVAPPQATSTPSAQTLAAPAPAGAPVTAQPSLPAATPALPQQLPLPTGLPVVIYASEPQLAGSTQAAAQPQQAQTPQTTPQATATPSNFSKTPDIIPPNISKLIVAQPQALAQTTSGNILAALSPVPTATLPPAVVQNNQYAVYTKSNAGIAINTPVATLPPQLPAYVTNQNEDGTVTLQTPQGAVTVKPETSGMPPALLAAGNAVTLALPAVFTPPAATGQNILQDSFTATLKQIFSFASSTSPAAANDLMKRLPSVGPDFVSSAVSFTTSLMRGNMRRILGDTLISKLTESGSGDLVEKVSSQAARTSLAFTQEPDQPQANSNWMSLSLPYVYQGAIQEARIYVKRDQSKKQDNQAKKATTDTRFIVEVTFSDMGELQLDGLVLPRESSTVFDLVVRTQVPFTPEERNDIVSIYNEAAEMTGYKGSINFFVGKDFPVKPLAEMIASVNNDIIA